MLLASNYRAVYEYPVTFKDVVDSKKRIQLFFEILTVHSFFFFFFAELSHCGFGGWEGVAVLDQFHCFIVFKQFNVSSLQMLK